MELVAVAAAEEHVVAEAVMESLVVMRELLAAEKEESHMGSSGTQAGKKVRIKACNPRSTCAI